MEQKKIEPKEIHITDKILYDARHPKYGRAEFQICPIFKYGKLKQVIITRAQQDRQDRQFILNVAKDMPNANMFQIEAWTHLTESPRIWREFWCKEHKTICHETYVPPVTDEMVFDYHFGNTVSIRFQNSERSGGMFSWLKK
jgi:hypothetical protein